MTESYSSPGIDNSLVSAESWSNETGIHELLTWLRNNDPVRRIDAEGFDSFWNITKYDDIKAIEGNKTLFINDPRPTLTVKGQVELVQSVLGRKHLIRSLIAMDDPDHMKYRKLTQGWFMGSNLRKLQANIDALAVKYVDRMAELGGECDFVKDVAVWYPLRVIMQILGVPDEDEPLMLKLTQELFGPADPDNQRSFEPNDFFKVVADFEGYFNELTKARRAKPSDDVASVIANAEFDGEYMPELDANGYYTIIATAGHDTTSASIAGGLNALIENPSEMQKLREAPDKHMGTAIDEMIRWVTPVRHFMRTATADTEVRGQKIKAGESVMLWYPSANRDEDVFDAPFEFRVERTDAKQLAFGFGAHVCLGQHLAKMEMAALMKELLNRVSDIEVVGELRYTHSNFVGGLKSLPIRYRMK